MLPTLQPPAILRFTVPPPTLLGKTHFPTLSKVSYFHLIPTAVLNNISHPAHERRCKCPLQEQGKPDGLHVQARTEEPTQFVVLKSPFFSWEQF